MDIRRNFRFLGDGLAAYAGTAKPRTLARYSGPGSGQAPGGVWVMSVSLGGKRHYAGHAPEGKVHYCSRFERQESW